MISDEEKYHKIVEVLGVDEEKDNLAIVDTWIAQSGIDEVYQRILYIEERTM